MDKSLLLQLIKKDLEDIQILFQHFEAHPSDLEKGIELAAAKMENLNQEFRMLKQNLNGISSDLNKDEKKVEVLPQKETPQEIKTEQKPAVEQIPPPPVTEPISVPEEVEEKSAVNEKVEVNTAPKVPDILSSKLSSRRIADIRSGIGINDKFLFIRELFDNQAEQYRTTIEYLNQANSLEDALNWLHSNYEWDMEDPFVLQFLEITKRKFN